MEIDNPTGSREEEKAGVVPVSSLSLCLSSTDGNEEKAAKSQKSIATVVVFQGKRSTPDIEKKKKL